MPFFSSAHCLNVSFGLWNSQNFKTFLYPAEIFHFTENLQVCQILLNNPCMCSHTHKVSANYWGRLGNQWTQRWNMNNIYCGETSLLSLGNYCLYNINSPLSSFVHSCVLGIWWFTEAGQGFTLLWTPLFSRWWERPQLITFSFQWAHRKPPSITCDCLTPSNWKGFKEANNHRL